MPVATASASALAKFATAMLSSRSKARSSRAAQLDIEEVDGNGVEVPDDAVVALQLLRAQYPKTPAAGAYPVALLSQIYSLVKDRTAVDRQLDQAMRRDELRLFRMVGHATDGLVMHMDDYEAAARRAGTVYMAKRRGGSRGGVTGKRLKVGGDATCGERSTEITGDAGNVQGTFEGPDVADIVHRFLHGVLPEHPRVSISAADLKTSLAASREGLDGGATAAAASGGSGGAAAESSAVPLRRLTVSELQDAVEVLDNAGLIIRKDVNTWLFAIPGVGPLQAQVLYGRQELLQVSNLTRNVLETCAVQRARI